MGMKESLVGRAGICFHFQSRDGGVLYAGKSFIRCDQNSFGLRRVKRKKENV